MCREGGGGRKMIETTKREREEKFERKAALDGHVLIGSTRGIYIVSSEVMVEGGGGSAGEIRPSVEFSGE